MMVLREWPPNIDEIAAAIPAARGQGVLFCYGNIIYNPDGGKITYPLKMHEAVHSRRQGSSDSEIRTWWSRYLADTEFRYNEELPAHQAEYAAFCEHEHDKQKRFRFLVTVAQRLSSSLYGAMVSFTEAKKAIKEGV